MPLYSFNVIWKELRKGCFYNTQFFQEVKKSMNILNAFNGNWYFSGISIISNLESPIRLCIHVFIFELDAISYWIYGTYEWLFSHMIWIFAAIQEYVLSSIQHVRFTTIIDQEAALIVWFSLLNRTKDKKVQHFNNQYLRNVGMLSSIFVFHILNEVNFLQLPELCKM